MRLRSAAVAAQLMLIALAIEALVTACGESTSDPIPRVATVEVDPVSVTREIAQTTQLIATVRDADRNVLPNEPVTWSSSSNSVASVSVSGLVTANAPGTAVITATSGSRSGHATITVVDEPIANITVSPSVDTLTVGESVQLSAVLRDAAGNVLTDRSVTWTSADAGIVSVSNSGLATGVGDGLVSITASAGDRSGSATIRAFGRCSPYLAASIAVGQTVEGELTATDCRMSDCVLCGMIPDPAYTDLYAISVAVPTPVRIDMVATYDSFLYLRVLQNGVMAGLAPDGATVLSHAESHKNVSLVRTLEPGRSYYIFAGAFAPNVTGRYQLKVTAQ